MDANEIRKIVNEVNPPVRGKPLTLTTELSAEIAQVSPFWKDFLRKRDIRDAEGGDEYVTGLIETFSRIYTALKARNVHVVLAPLDLPSLYNLDTELSKSDMGLPDEYPALEMAGVKDMGSFGAGILMAYALFETALAVDGNPKKPAPKPPAAPQAEAPQSLVDDLLAGLPEDETSSPAPTENIGPMKGTPVRPPSSKTEKKSSFLDWNFDPQMGRSQPAPLMLLGVYPAADGILVRGEIPPTLAGAAQAYNVVQVLFGRDANISAGPRGLEFSFAYPQEGGPS